LRNHSASDTGVATSAPSAEGCTPGGTVPGGYSTHFLAPQMRPFQAEVALGSTWKEEPLRSGPRMSHLGAGGGFSFALDITRTVAAQLETSLEPSDLTCGLSSSEDTTTRQGQTVIDSPASCSRASPPPPGYLLVTVRLAGERAVDELPVEVLPCHTFADVCAAALARVPDAPLVYGIQAFLVVGDLEVPLQDPHTPARATLRSFPSVCHLRFDVGPSDAQSRTVRASRVARRRRQWPRRLARIAVGFAKACHRPTSSTLGSGEGGGVGSETEEAMEAVAAFVAGRAPIQELQRFDARVVVRALAEIDTEVLEELDVPDVPGTRAAVSRLLQKLREDQAAAAERARAAAAGASADGAEPAEGEGEGEARGEGDAPVAAPDGAVAANGAERASPAEAAGGKGGGQQGEGEAAAQPLPGFGPAAVGPRAGRTRTGV
ncbi:hypothetical protein TSOC_005474, partial [Tetrabaena socialis]